MGCGRGQARLRVAARRTSSFYLDRIEVLIDENVLLRDVGYTNESFATMESSSNYHLHMHEARQRRKCAFLNEVFSHILFACRAAPPWGIPTSVV